MPAQVITAIRLLPLRAGSDEKESWDSMTQPSRFCTSDVLGRRTVLLVEDESFVREATSSILENAGFRVLPAVDADDAMKIYEECGHLIDLVMTDMILPGRTGRQLGDDLHHLSPGIKILITSGYGNAEYTTEEPESQTYFLAKPYSRRGLIEKIQEMLATAPLRLAAGQAG